MKLQAVKEKAMQDKRLQEYLKKAGFSFNDVTIKELTSKSWRVLQKGMSEAVILIVNGIKLILPL